MKKTHIIHSSYLSFILALAFSINENYVVAAISMIVSALLLSIIFISSKKQFEFYKKDLALFIVLLVVSLIIRNSLVSITPALFIVAIMSALFNTVFVASLRTISKKSADFIVKTIIYCLSFVIVGLVIIDGFIAYSLQLTQLASIGYLYLLILNYIPILTALILQRSQQFFKRLILS